VKHAIKLYRTALADLPYATVEVEAPNIIAALMEALRLNPDAESASEVKAPLQYARPNAGGR